ncbi:MAG: hypothetical protein V4495_16990 [Pseudomonadota bacterium]
MLVYQDHTPLVQKLYIHISTRWRCDALNVNFKIREQYIRPAKEVAFIQGNLKVEQAILLEAGKLFGPGCWIQQNFNIGQWLTRLAVIIDAVDNLCLEIIMKNTQPNK